MVLLLMNRKEFIRQAPDESKGESASARMVVTLNFDDLDGLNTRVLQALRALRNEVVHGATTDRVKMHEMRQAFERILAVEAPGALRTIGGLEVHHRLIEGLPGISLALAGALTHETIEDLTVFFGMTPKTFRGRLKQDHLGLDESERVLRSVRVTVAASDVFGGFDQAREYLRTKNFALGGYKPIDLIQTAEGERIVLDELYAQAHSAPL